MRLTGRKIQSALLLVFIALAIDFGLAEWQIKQRPCTGSEQQVIRHNERLKSEMKDSAPIYPQDCEMPNEGHFLQAIPSSIILTFLGYQLYRCRFIALPFLKAEQ